MCVCECGRGGLNKAASIVYWCERQRRTREKRVALCHSTGVSGDAHAHGDLFVVRFWQNEISTGESSESDSAWKSAKLSFSKSVERLKGSAP